MIFGFRNSILTQNQDFIFPVNNPDLFSGGPPPSGSVQLVVILNESRIADIIPVGSGTITLDALSSELFIISTDGKTAIRL